MSNLEPFFFMKLELDNNGQNRRGCDVRMYGKSPAGQTVVVRLNHYSPHFYVSFDTSQRFRFVATEIISRIHRDSIPVVQMYNMKPGLYSSLINDKTHFVYDQKVYHDSRLRHLAKVRVKTFFDIGQVVKVILEIVANQLKENECYSLTELARCVHFYESNIDAKVRVANLLGVRPCQWSFIRKSRFDVSHEGQIVLYTHTCNEADEEIKTGTLFETVNVPPPPDFPPPVSVMSFDIECLAEDLGVFPTADRCPIIQISCVTAPDSLGRSEYNTGDMIDKRVYVLGTCDSVEGVRVLNFDTEKAMLQQFVGDIVKLDPDIITGYNILSFDFPFLFERLHILGVEPVFGRCGRRSSCKRNSLDSSNKCYASHVPTTHYIEIEGRTLFDAIVYVKKEFKGLRSYTLNAVSEYFLKDKKDDVHYTYIPKLHRQGPDGRAKIAKYCVKDSKLVLDLVFHLQAFVHMNERSKVFNTTLQYMVDRGQQIKIVSMLLDYCGMRNILINDVITADKVMFAHIRGTMNDRLDTIAYGGRQTKGLAICKLSTESDKLCVLSNKKPTKPCSLSYNKPTKLISLSNNKPSQPCSLSNNKPSQPCSLSNNKPTKLCSLSNNKPTKLCSLSNNKPSQPCSLSNNKPTKLCSLSNNKPSTIYESKRKFISDEEEEDESDQECILESDREEDYEVENQTKRTVNFTGAIVIEPKRGLYHNPVICLDFASLYPSIMIAHNLCYTTMIIDEADGERLVDEGLAHRTENGHFFFNTDVKKGVLPTILSMLMDNRAAVRKRMRSVDSDSIVYRMLDGQQLALKIAANSIYGWTGFQKGQLFYLQIPSSVTSYGREMITRTKDYVEANYKQMQVIYGDTDSVMIHVTDWDKAVNRLWQCYDVGTKIASEVTAMFNRPPISLEFETVYMPYMLSSKKKYAAGKYTDLERYAKDPQGPPPEPVFKCSGLEVVRRDNCLLVKKSLARVLDMVIKMKTADEILHQMKRDMDDLWHGRVDLIDLVITKEWKKRSRYAQPHDRLAQKMNERNAGDAPNIGDRVPYIIVEKEGLPISERSEDPLRVLEHGLPVDYTYYAEKQLMNPLSNVLSIAMPDKDREDVKDMLWPDPYSSRPGKKYGRGHKKLCSSKVAKQMKDYFITVAKDYNRTFGGERTVLTSDIEDLCLSLAATCLECKSADRQAVTLCKNRECGTLYKRYAIAKTVRNAERRAKIADACEVLGFY